MCVETDLIVAAVEAVLERHLPGIVHTPASSAEQAHNLDVAVRRAPLPAYDFCLYMCTPNTPCGRQHIKTLLQVPSPQLTRSTQHPHQPGGCC